MDKKFLELMRSNFPLPLTSLLTNVPPEMSQEAGLRLYKKLFSDLPKKRGKGEEFLILTRLKVQRQKLFFKHLDAFNKMHTFQQANISDELLRIFIAQVQSDAPDDYLQQLEIFKRKIKEHNQ